MSNVESVKTSSMTRTGFGAVICLVIGLIATVFASPASASRAHLYTGSSIGPEGTSGAAQFSKIQGVAVDQSTQDIYVYDTGAGKVYKFDSNGTPADFSGLGVNFVEGAGGSAESGANEIAVAPVGAPGGTAGDIYVANASAVLVYSASGAQIGKLEGLGESCGVATNPAGHVFVGSYPTTIREFTPTANPVVVADQTGESTTSLPEICNVAADGLGNLYAANYSGHEGVVKLEGLGASSASPVDPSAATLAVNPASNDLYADRGSVFTQYDSSGNLLSTSGAGQLQNSRGIAVNGTTGKIYAGNGGSGKVDIFGSEIVISPIVAEQVSNIDTHEATFEATIDPEGQSTTFHFEYGTSQAYDHTTPEVSLGSEATVQTVSSVVKGLEPDTTYHWRVVATNSTVSNGQDMIFKTPNLPVSDAEDCLNQAHRTGAGAELPNCRAYELVSPIEKNNTDIVSLINVNGQPAALDQGATDGEKLTYTTSQGFGDTKGVPYVSQYMASRTAGGWLNHSLTSPQGLASLPVGSRVDLEFTLFSSDLCKSVLLNFTDPPLAAGAPEGVPNLYRRNNCGGEEISALSTVPHGNAAPNVQGMSADGKCALYEYTTLYESCEGQIRPVSVRPNGEVVTEASVVGTSGGLQTEFAFRLANLQNAVSTDGSRIYWTRSESAGPLYLRLNAQQEQSANGAGEECTEPTKACTIPVSGGGEAFFWGASPNGDRAFYSKNGDLYEFNLATRSSTLITSGVVGVLGVDQSATRIYFASHEEFEGLGATGIPNLYLFDSTKAAGDQARLLGTLSAEDEEFEGSRRYGPIIRSPVLRTSRLSPDGRHAVFTSTAPLTGYDNTDSVVGKPDAEVFVYDATADDGAGELHCVSCNPTGQFPTGRNLVVESLPSGRWFAAAIPPFATSFYGSRVISDNGNRVFFNSYESLLPRDTNGKEDVYEWEAPGGELGPGKCTTESASYSPANGGCVSLISSGESPSDSEFIDAGPDGRDAFFTTASSLVIQDPGLIDIYDAREGGGFPPPPGQPAACEGEACQGPFSPPTDPTPGSLTFQGAGNVHGKSPCAKGKVRRKGHCVKKSKKGKSKQAKNGRRAANTNRRAGR